MQCYILSILLHAFETLTLTKNMESKRKAFEMCGNRLMLRNIKPMNKFYKWQIKQGRYYQPQRKGKKMLLEAKIEGKKGRGKPRVTWTKKKKKKKKIKEWLGRTYNGCVVVNFLSP